MLDKFFNNKRQQEPNFPYNTTDFEGTTILQFYLLSTISFLTSFVDEEKHRQVLAKAIYEEWYFKKQEEELKKKAEARRQQRVKQWEMQHVSFSETISKLVDTHSPLFIFILKKLCVKKEVCGVVG